MMEGNGQAFRLLPVSRVKGFFGRLGGRLMSRVWGFIGRVRVKLASKQGQGTTEYAILVGVLVVIAIVAIIAFRPALQSLWDAIQEGINSLGESA